MTSPPPEDPDPQPSIALHFVDVVKEYRLGDTTVRALDGVSLAVPSAQFVAVTGRSGSGKSTLLNLAAGIDVPTAGQVWVEGTELSRLSDDALTRLRRERVGVIYQFFNLISTLSVLENVALPAELAGRPGREAFAAAGRLVEEVGLSGRRDAKPHALSGGEMQRAAIARALVLSPAIVLADEPTGNLDSRAAAQVLGLLGDLATRHGATVVLVTHSPEAAASASRIVELHDGRVGDDRETPR